jgi:hypothetical protein
MFVVVICVEYIFRVRDESIELVLPPNRDKNMFSLIQLSVVRTSIVVTFPIGVIWPR